MTRPPWFVLDRRAERVAWALLAAGGAAAAIGIGVSPQRAWPSLLLNAFYMMTLALGGMVFIAIQYLSGAAWSANLRRVPEALMAALPAASILMLSLFFGREWLYPWSRPAAYGGEIAHPAYLSAPFFFARMALFAAIWTIFAFRMRRASVGEDGNDASIHHRRLVRYSAMFLPAFAITFSLASFDWLMTLVPHWSSTIFAVYAIAGVLLGAVAAVTLGVVLLLERGDLEGVVNEHHLHDLGKLLFAFSIFWAYIWVSQYLLIWYGNLPEETAYYVTRTGSAWMWLFLLNLAVNWIVPFAVLMSFGSKRRRGVLKWTAVLILAGRWLDVYLVVMPQVLPRPGLHALDALIVVGCLAGFFLLATRALGGAPLVPRNNPSFERSLAHHQ